MKVELFRIEGCAGCAASGDELRAAALGAFPGVTWRDVDPTRELDYAVALGVASLPSVAIDGRVVFTSLPTAQQLRQVVLAHGRGLPNGR